MRIASCCILILFLPWGVFQQGLEKELFLASPRALFTAVEADGKIYFAGGLLNGNQMSSTIDVFDISTQTWNTTLTLSSPRAFVSPAVIPPHIYFVSGWHTVFATTPYLYDSQSVSLQAVPQISMQRPIQISIYGTTLVMLGSHSAAFIDLTDTGEGWSTIDELDYVMQRTTGAVLFCNENLIFICGGVNVSSRQPVSDAWIYDIETHNLTHYKDAISQVGSIPSNQFKSSVTNNIVAMWTYDATTNGCFLFNIDTSTWFTMTTSATNVVSVPGFTFIFTSSGYYTVDWSNPNAEPVLSNSTGPIVHSLVFEEHAAYFVNEPSGTMYCFDNEVWTRSVVAPSISTIVKTLDWPPSGSVFTTSEGIYLFNNCSIIFTAQTNILSVVMSHPVPDRLYVALSATGSNSTLNKYDATLSVVESISVPLVPEVCFDNILFQFRFMKAFSLTTLSTPSTMFTGSFDARTKWIAKGSLLVALVVDSGTTYVMEQVDIYNYKTGTWLNSTSHPALSQTSGYAQAFNMDGVLAVFTSSLLLRFNVSTYLWQEDALSEPVFLSSANVSPMALEVNDTVYATTSILRLRIVSHGAITFDLITDQEVPFQIVYNAKFNQLFVTTLQKRVYTWSLANQQAEIFLFPRPEEEIIMATSGAYFVASAYSNMNALEYCDLSTSQWYTVPGVANYIRPAAMRGFTERGRDYVITAGGNDKELQYFTDSVKVILLGQEEEPVTAPLTEVIVAPRHEEDPKQDNTTLIVAIVVPVGAVLIGGLLAIFLVSRRNKKRHNNGHQMSTMGLEQQYGQWFIPFTSLTFHEQLGQGASGQVFKGTWNNTTVALKLSMTQANSSVIDELTLMMQLRPHPNVVQLLGFSVHPETDSIVLVIEYCNQGALNDILFNDKATIPMKQKLEWLIGIAKGLSHLHSNNIIHRDVAARNVLMHQNEAKLTDFGMSRIVDSQQQRGTTKSELGPIRWMSPESLKNKEYSTKSDVWSFGVVAYEIIAQQEPHTSADPIQVGRLIRDSGLTPQLPDTCPNDVRSVIQSCWHMVPSQRPSFEEITSQLESVRF